MARKASVVCSVAFLGVLAAATGFAAEVTRIKASDVKRLSITQCTYPRSVALGLGLTASAALLIAQIIINFATGCICCCKRTHQTLNYNWTKAIVFYVVSWITFVIAFLMLLTAALSDQHLEGSVNYGNYRCYVVRPGFFAGGTALAAASVILGIFYYLTLNETKNTSGPSGNAPLPNQGGITMGQPQFPPQSSQDPACA